MSGSSIVLHWHCVIVCLLATDTSGTGHVWYQHFVLRADQDQQVGHLWRGHDCSRGEQKNCVFKTDAEARILVRHSDDRDDEAVPL